MKFLRIFMMLCMMLSLLPQAYARSQHLNPNYTTADLTAEINRIVANTDSHAAIGINIKSMKYGDTIYTKNDQRSFIPASILKIFTAEAALLYLGSEYKFPTSFFTDSTHSNKGIINGNLYLVHSGDPSLTYTDLTTLMSALKSQQIQSVTGNVYIDNTAYDQIGFGPGWDWDDKRYCYAAPINASIINHNCLSFKIKPAKKSGQIANIVPNPHYYYGAIQNEVMTKSSRARSCYLRLGVSSSNNVAISGCLPKGRYAQGVSTVISDVMQYNKSMLQRLFQSFGIHVNGSINAGAAPPHAAMLAVHESKPLHTLVNEMLKMSDNIIAGSLFKKIGELYTQQPGSWQNGSLAVKKIFGQKATIDLSQMNILDGSGLSPNNRITPHQMIQVLDFAYHHDGTSTQFISSLPIAGIDGTLKHRLGHIAGKVRAKTGTLSDTGVVSLAGYAVSRTKEPIAFVIIVNGHQGNAWKYREMEDKIVTALTNYSRE
jgi:D-alanyl-D-alanine carboxypeptidase/D-alanyl-D-alanine-endopeptidase (penicillin-binding protein 4)